MTPGIRELQILKSEYQYYPEYARARTKLCMSMHCFLKSTSLSFQATLAAYNNYSRATGIAAPPG